MKNEKLINELKQAFIQAAKKRDFSEMRNIYDKLQLYTLGGDKNLPVVCFSEIDENNAIKMPPEVISYLKDFDADCIYILKNEYIALFFAEYTEDLANLLRLNYVEVKHLYIDDSLQLNQKALKTLGLVVGDIVRFTVDTDNIFIDKLEPDYI